MKSWVIVNIFYFHFKISSSRKINCKQCYLFLISWHLYSKCSVLRINFMGNDCCVWSVFSKLFWVEEMINLSFGLKKHNDGSFFIMLLLNVLNDFRKQCILRALIKKYFSFAMLIFSLLQTFCSILINWWLYEGSSDSEFIYKDLPLFFTHTCQCSCHS